eukprot:NODE_3147_length_379_cov_45.936364_g3065_i0.p3 GENE.NODE_3147_length_379_cov_45.936364_g3065_i0~~NODE_3147_length_379_cov_45.936364_g3065_i0.p3  ORF type:complete len:50 (+),score=3.12 NODE_3147_length_379_cov_45.936364_g3065_i0:69-218(+)
MHTNGVQNTRNMCVQETCKKACPEQSSKDTDGAINFFQKKVGGTFCAKM